MWEIMLTKEEIRILQYVADNGGITVSQNQSAAQYRRLAEAGFLEQQAASLDTEWFGITDKGRDTLAKWY